MISYHISNDARSQMKILNKVIPNTNALLQFCFKFNFGGFKFHKAACHLTKFDVINDVRQHIANF